MASQAQFRHEDVSAVPRGYKVRTVSHPSGHQVRVAYPPGPRRTGAGKVVSILHPKGENARCQLNVSDESKSIIAEYKRLGMDALVAKGGGFHVRGRGYVSLRQARKETGIDMHSKKESRELLPWGDYATVAMLSKSRSRNPKSKIQNPKSRTREQVGKMQEKAVKFLRNVVKDSDKADEVEALSVSEYAERKKIALTNPGREKISDWKAVMVERLLSAYQGWVGAGWSKQDAIKETLRKTTAGSAAKAEFLRLVENPGREKVKGKKAKGKNLSNRRNLRKNAAQTEAAAALYAIFHGKKPKEIVELHQDVIRREDYAALGQLIEITLPDLNLAIDFENDKVLLAASPNGKQMYVIGGNQDIKALLGKLADDEKDFLDLGEVGAVVYRTRKDFDKFEEIDYKHKMGEGGHERPRLMYDKLNKQLYFVGGEYDASRHEGIVH